jgi:uncharacterized protein YjiS (DUF1127 family)
MFSPSAHERRQRKEGDTEMSVMFFERSASHHGTWQAIADKVTRFATQMRRQQKARRDRRHLMQLPDYLLKDIGMSRLEVDAMTAPDDRRRFVVLPDIGWSQKQ